MFDIDWVIIIPHNDTFSDIGQKPPFSVILWQLEGQSWAKVVQKSKTILKTHPISVHTKFELVYVNTFSDYGW